MIDKDPSVINDVYSRFFLSPQTIPNTPTPSSHTNEMELYCVKQAAAAYSVYPSNLLKDERVPSQHADLFQSRQLATEGFFGGAAETGEGGTGWGRVVADRVTALVVWNQDRIVVAFRGTANWQDWVHNFANKPVRISDALPWRGPNSDAMLHRGFLGLAENIWPATAQFIQKRVQSKNAQLTLCGHSLGGAIAVAVGIAFPRSYYYRDREWEPRIVATYTFGAPRLGTRGTIGLIRRPHYRLITRGDPVPALPPRFEADYEATYLSSRAERKPGIGAGIRHFVTSPFRRVAEASGLLIPAHFIESYERAIKSKIDLIGALEKEARQMNPVIVPTDIPDR